MPTETDLRTASAADSKIAALEALGPIHEKACRETGFPQFNVDYGIPPFPALISIGKKLFFRDLDALLSGSLSRKEKSQCISQSVRLMQQCAGLRIRMPAEETHKASVKKFYQEDGHFLNSDGIRNRYAKMFEPLQRGAPPALADVYAKAAGEFEYALKELAEVEQLEALGETEEDDFPPLPEKSELRYHAAKAVADAETARCIAEILRRTQP